MIVVDCSAVVDAVAADATEVQALLAAETMHAPPLLDAEVLSAVRGLVLGGHLAPGRAGAALDDFGALPIVRWALNAPLRHRVLALRANLTAYDAIYVALAESLDCPLVTRDRKLAAAGGHRAEITVC